MSDPTTSRRLLAGNWKMNLDYRAGLDLAEALAPLLAESSVPVVYCTPAIHLQGLSSLVGEQAIVRLGAQDISAHESGAYTGEISGEQLKSVGCRYVIVGHSERRAYHAEAGALLADKVRAALRSQLTPIYCFGETLAQREQGDAEQIVAGQLSEGLGGLDADQAANVVLAYEPVWAIGTGVTATAEQAQAIHAYVRAWLDARFGGSLAQRMTILYGGSVKPDNAAELFSQPDIDGGLIGGASLKAGDFAAIASAFQ